MTARMRRLIVAIVAPALVLAAAIARAQEPPPRIGPFVVDLHGTVPAFPSESPALAASRDIAATDLPGHGFGVDAAAQIYLLRFRVMTVGIGGNLTVGRSRSSPLAGQTGRAVTERLTSLAPQLSLNFGNGHGWSYLSGGLGTSNWAVVPEGQEGFPADSENLKTLDYGGGARWFAKSHLAFSLDVRIYVISPGTPFLAGAPGSPRTNLLVIGAGISIK